jgi:hypothetical protein
MSRGPKPGTRPGHFADPVTTMRLHWGDAAPDWIVALAERCDKVGQAVAAAEVGYSAGVISGALRKTYAGDLSRVELKVRGALMRATVICPVLDEITTGECLEWQAKPFAVTSPRRVKVYLACRRGCPHSRIKTGLKGASDAER